MDVALDAVLAKYALRTTTHRFADVAALIANDVVCWFSDGS
jgi:hypothetical protein